MLSWVDESNEVSQDGIVRAVGQSVFWLRPDATRRAAELDAERRIAKVMSGSRKREWSAIRCLCLGARPERCYDSGCVVQPSLPEDRPTGSSPLAGPQDFLRGCSPRVFNPDRVLVFEANPTYLR